MVRNCQSARESGFCSPQAWRGRKYVLARNELEAFLRSLEEVYDVVVRLLDDASGKGSRGGTP
jgi:hypothetical protein